MGRRSKREIPGDFPSEYRLGGTEMFREILGGLGASTFARHLADGIIPPPDMKLGTLNRWRETTMAKHVGALAKGTAPDIAKADVERKAKEAYLDARRRMLKDWPLWSRVPEEARLPYLQAAKTHLENGKENRART